MKRPLPITTLFVDVGGVLLTHGWDHLANKRFVQIAERLGAQSVPHVDHESTRAKLTALGLLTDEPT
jgi:hypothetical protein